jgi:hypothetical protein
MICLVCRRLLAIGTSLKLNKGGRAEKFQERLRSCHHRHRHLKNLHRKHQIYHRLPLLLNERKLNARDATTKGGKVEEEIAILTRRRGLEHDQGLEIEKRKGLAVAGIGTGRRARRARRVDAIVHTHALKEGQDHLDRQTGSERIVRAREARVHRGKDHRRVRIHRDVSAVQEMMIAVRIDTSCRERTLEEVQGEIGAGRRIVMLRFHIENANGRGRLVRIGKVKRLG